VNFTCGYPSVKADGARLATLCLNTLFAHREGELTVPIAIMILILSADVVAAAFRELGLEPRFQEFDLVGYEADEPELEVEGEVWPVGPCMYAHSFEGEGTVRRIGASPNPIGEGKLTNFAVVDTSGREVARLLTSPFSTGTVLHLEGGALLL